MKHAANEKRVALKQATSKNLKIEIIIKIFSWCYLYVTLHCGIPCCPHHLHPTLHLEKALFGIAPHLYSLQGHRTQSWSVNDGWTVLILLSASCELLLLRTFLHMLICMTAKLTRASRRSLSFCSLKWRMSTKPFSTCSLQENRANKFV